MKIKIFNKITNEEIMVLEGKVSITPEAITNERGEGLKGYKSEVVGYEILDNEGAECVLIAAKTRELAVAALKAEGKLDQSGKIPKEIKP